MHRSSTNPIARAMSLLIPAMALVPIMDTIAKSLSGGDLSPTTVAFGRFVAQTIWILLVFATWRGVVRSEEAAPPSMRPKNVALNLTRGALHGGGSMVFFVALKYMPLADSIAVFFVEPMILLLLSAVFLKEFVGWPRRIASLVAFGGALLVIQPSYELFGAVSLLPLLAALLFAFYLLVTRFIGPDEHPLTMQLFSGIGAIIAIGIVLIGGAVIDAPDYQFTMPDTGRVVGLLAIIGVVSTVAHLMVTTAYTMAPASVLAPFNYFEIVTATIFGYVFFDDFPGLLQWTGIAIIVGMGLFIFFRERSLERTALKSADQLMPFG